MVDLSNPDVRERLAQRAYYRAKLDEAARDGEQRSESSAYFTLAWESLDDETRRPFRAGVDETCDVLVAAA